MAFGTRGREAGAVSGIELVAGVIGMFFAAGIAAGVLIVALPRVRRRRRYDRNPDGGWREPPGPGRGWAAALARRVTRRLTRRRRGAWAAVIAGG